ncbi:hypothetical protein IAR55_005265 [Kwoniella newhampshirensis]|uniref:RRM domain-containing protein n=1 Tax=Kwoniella newhampshirensis TaxID=1651941 RepID=A0AAW0YVW5_9TREE
MTTKTPHSLDPSSPPFAFPRASPSFTSHSTSTTSSSSVANSTSSTSHSDTPRAPGRSGEGVSVKAKPFGAGWKSSSTSSFLSATTDEHPTLLQPAKILPRRSRSPSVPTLLPSHVDAFDNRRKGSHDHYTQPTYHLPPNFEIFTPLASQEPLMPALEFSPSSPPSSDSHRYTSISSGRIDFDDRMFPTMECPANNPLLHQRSTPNLPFIGANGRAVRFDTEDSVIPGQACGLRRRSAFNYGSLQGNYRGRLTASASMPVLPMLGEGRNVFIHRVNEDLSEEELRQYASSFGEVVSVKIPARTTKPHAFVMFKKPEQAQEFIRHLTMTNIECEFGKEDYQVQNKALEDPNSANLYIAGLPTTITYEDLAEVLAPGRICSWKPLMDDAGNRRGPIMARLQTRPQAEDVIKRLNGKYFPGMSEKLQVRIADSEEQKHFKRQQTMVRDRSSFDSDVEPVNRGASITADRIVLPVDEDAADPIALLHQQSVLANELKVINERLARANLVAQGPFPVTPPPRKSIGPVSFPTSPDNFHSVITPITHSGWRHRHASSGYSAESMMGLGLSWPNSPRNLPLRSYASNDNITSAHDLARQTSNGQKYGGDKRVFSGNLHYTKSSPELSTFNDGHTMY